MLSSNTISIATRKSPLALWQAQRTQALLQEQGLLVDLFPVVTTGDKMQKSQLADVQIANDKNAHLSTGKGLFIKEIQDALMNEQASVAVHSMKDLPVSQTKGLKVISVLPRAIANDVLILSPELLNEIKTFKNNNFSLDELNFFELLNILKKCPSFCTKVIGTTSSRRQMLLKKYFSESINLQILRGNVDTRLKRLRNNEFVAILLAQAGLERLGLFPANDMYALPITEFIPATAQGVIAVETRSNDLELIAHIKKLGCAQSAIHAAVERVVLYFLGGDCHSSIGVHFNGKEIYVICGCNDVVKESTYFVSETEFADIKKLYYESECEYTLFFEVLAQSIFSKNVQKFLLQAQFDKVSEIRF